MENDEKKVTISVAHNGPLLVEGKFTIVDKDGKVIPEDGKVALCRCGRSHHKPFCDGTHVKVHFDDTAD